MRVAFFKGLGSFFIVSSIFVFGCFTKLDTTPEEVEKKINTSLKPGDAPERIEAYFKKESLGLSYDKYQGRYQSIIRHPESNFHAITIYIYVDKNKRFIRVEANDSYTFL